MKIRLGSYTGDGTASNPITGIGFQPGAVFIFPDAIGTGAWTTDKFTAGEAQKLTAPLTVEADLIISLDADGFTVGGDAEVNTNTAKYHFVALFLEAGDSMTGTYEGTGSDNRNITGVGFQPDLLIIGGSHAQDVTWRNELNGGDNAQTFGANGINTNRINALQPDGFQLGNSVQVNQLGVTYHYLALKNVAGRLKTFTYTGDGTDDRSITGAGFRPQFAITVNDSGIGPENACFRGIDHSGDESTELNTAKAADQIQAFEEDGMQIGTLDPVNENTEDFFGWWLRNTAAKATVALFI
jgi:hypothetical protein